MVVGGAPHPCSWHGLQSFQSMVWFSFTTWSVMAKGCTSVGTKGTVYKGYLFCCIHFLSENVVTMVIQGVDDTQLVVEWVVGAEIQVLVGVSGLSVYLHFHLPIFLLRDLGSSLHLFSPHYLE